MHGAEVDHPGFFAVCPRLEEFGNIITLRPLAKFVCHPSVAGMVSPIEILGDRPIDGMPQEGKTDAVRPPPVPRNKRKKMTRNKAGGPKALDCPDLRSTLQMRGHIFTAKNLFKNGAKRRPSGLWEMVEEKFSIVQRHRTGPSCRATPYSATDIGFNCCRCRNSTSDRERSGN